MNNKKQEKIKEEAQKEAYMIRAAALIGEMQSRGMSLGYELNKPNYGGEVNLPELYGRYYECAKKYVDYLTMSSKELKKTGEYSIENIMDKDKKFTKIMALQKKLREVAEPDGGFWDF